MKRILSVLLVLVMVLGMLPVIASAADTEVLFELGANGSASHYDGTEKSTHSETVNGYTLSITGGTKMYTGARDAKGNSCIKLGTGSAAGSFSLTVPDDVTSVIINVAAYKAKTATVTVNGTATKLTTKSDNGAYDAITVDTTRTKTVSFAVTSGYRAMVNSIKFIVASSGEGEVECEHAKTVETEAVAATCTEVGYTAGVFCNDCETYIEGHELVDLVPHTESVTDEKAATCTEDGYTQYTCSVCEKTRKEYIDATGHNYVDGMCSGCGLELPDDLSGQYYIAAIRKEGNYWYMTNNLGTASTLRYQIVDSGVTELPESIEDIVESQLFELVAVDGGYVIKTGEQYLGYTSGNSGALVALDDAKVVTIEYSSTEGAYNIHFTVSADDERYLALNNAADSPWYAWYKGAGNQIQDLYLVPVAENAEVCEHANATTEGAVDATCTTEGATGATVCPDCGVTIQANEVIPALGHDYVDGICSVCGAEKPATPTTGKIDFATTTQRVSQDTNSQVWTDGTLKVTNNKASSSSNIIDSSNPVRFYKSSDVVIEFPGMTKIVVVCNNTTYATALESSVKDATVTADGTTITIELAKAADSFTISLTGGQVRVNSMTVYASKVCNHVWGDAVQTLAPNCAEEGVNTYTCSLCNETKTESIPALGHVIVDGVCSVCSGNIYPLVTALNENDNVILYNPANKVAMGNTVNTYSKMDSVSAAASNGIAVQDGMGIMTVKYVEGSETDFYLMLDGKYLNAGATGNKMYLTEEADDYAIWYLKVIDEAEGLVYLNSRNAKYEDNMQSVEYYNGSFTTYGGSGDAFKMKLYAVAGEVKPAVEITHISLNPAKDALGYKAEAQNLPEGTHVEISLWVNDNIVVTKATSALRLVNIMACNGGEMTIYAKATIVDAEGKVIAESAVAKTTMKETVETVNALTNLTSEQKAAVYDLYEQYSDIMDAWLGENNNIKTWAPVEE